MVKNWMILGDDAFTANDGCWGNIDLSRKQMKNWQSIVLEQFNSAVEKSEKVRELIAKSKSLAIQFGFFSGSEVTKEHVEQFVQSMKERYGDKDIIYFLDYNREISYVCFHFTENRIFSEPEQEETTVVYVDERGMPMPDKYYAEILYRDFDGEWKKYEYKDLKGKVLPDGSYKIQLGDKEYEFNIKSIKPKNDPYQGKMCETYSFDSRKFTKMIKSRWLYFVEVSPNVVEAKPHESYIKEKISDAMKTEGEFIRHLFNRDVMNPLEEDFKGIQELYYVNYAFTLCEEILNLVESKEARQYVSKYIEEQLNEELRNVELQ